MRTGGIAFLALVLGALASGCEGEPLPPTEPNDPHKALQSARRVGLPSDYPFAVGVCTRGPLPRSARAAGEGAPAESHQALRPESWPCLDVCSGTLIAPTLVLTARHCLYTEAEDAELEGPFDCRRAPPFVSRKRDHRQVWITLANHLNVEADTPVTATTPNWFQAVNWWVPWDTSRCGADIAVIELEQPVKHVLDGAGTAKARRFAVHPAVPVFDILAQGQAGDDFRAIAYGDVRPRAHQAGWRRIRHRVAVSASAPEPVDADVTREFGAVEGLCTGDSGAGALLLDDAPPRVFGVFVRWKPDANDNCVRAVFTRLAPWRGFLAYVAAKAAERGNYALPEWAQAVAARVRPSRRPGWFTF
jgi:hypothetical protein